MPKATESNRRSPLTEKDLKNHTIRELQQIATMYGVDVASRSRKTELIEAILQSDNTREARESPGDDESPPHANGLRRSARLSNRDSTSSSRGARGPPNGSTPAVRRNRNDRATPYSRPSRSSPPPPPPLPVPSYKIGFNAFTPESSPEPEDEEEEDEAPIAARATDEEFAETLEMRMPIIENLREIETQIKDFKKITDSMGSKAEELAERVAAEISRTTRMTEFLKRYRRVPGDWSYESVFGPHPATLTRRVDGSWVEVDEGDVEYYPGLKEYLGRRKQKEQEQEKEKSEEKGKGKEKAREEKETSAPAPTVVAQAAPAISSMMMEIAMEASRASTRHAAAVNDRNINPEASGSRPRSPHLAPRPPTQQEMLSTLMSLPAWRSSAQGPQTPRPSNKRRHEDNENEEEKEGSDSGSDSPRHAARRRLDATPGPATPMPLTPPRSVGATPSTAADSVPRAIGDPNHGYVPGRLGVNAPPTKDPRTRPKF